MLLIGKRNNITNQHNIAGADIIRLRNSHDFYWHAACRVRRPDAPMPRKRHEIFAKVYLTDRRGELRSPLNFLWFSDNLLRIDSPCGCPQSAIADKIQIDDNLFCRKKGSRKSDSLVFLFFLRVLGFLLRLFFAEVDYDKRDVPDEYRQKQNRHHRRRRAHRDEHYLAE